MRYHGTDITYSSLVSCANVIVKDFFELYGLDQLYRTSAGYFPALHIDVIAVIRKSGRAGAQIGSIGEGRTSPSVGTGRSCGVNLKKSLRMMGPLNAAFEAISAYHLFARITAKPDVIYNRQRQNAFTGGGRSSFFC
jgi:hypothetical protein